MRPKTYVALFFLLSGLMLGGQGAMNVLMDPFKVFGIGLVPNYDVNPRYTKLRNLTREPGRYDALVLGTCLATVLRPETADALSGRRYFNMSTHNSECNEPGRFLRYALDRQVPVRQVLLNLEGFKSFQAWDTAAQREELDKRLDIRWPYFLTGKSRVEFYFPYVAGYVAARRSWANLWHLLHHVEPPIIEHPDGYWEWKSAADSLRASPRDHAREVLYSGWFNGLYLRNAETEPIPAKTPTALAELRVLAELAREHGIQVIPFLPSTWALRGHGSWSGEASAWQARQWVDLFGYFYDFALVTADTLNPANYLNRENFTPEMGDRLLDTVFGKPGGLDAYLVTAQNLDAYIRFKERQQRLFTERIQPVLQATPFEAWVDLDWSALAVAFGSVPDEPLPARAAITSRSN